MEKIEFSKQGIYLSGIHLPGVDLLTSLTPLDPPDEAGLMLPWRYRWVVRGVTGVEPIVDTDGRARRSFIGCCRVWSKHNQSHSLSTTLLITWAQVSITYIYFPVFTLTKTVWRPEIQDTSDLVVDSNPKTNPTFLWLISKLLNWQGFDGPSWQNDETWKPILAFLTLTSKHGSSMKTVYHIILQLMF